jgi:hypothetical protein
MEIHCNEKEWKTFYFIGAICVYAAMLVMLAEILITALPDGSLVESTAANLLEIYNRNCFIGMRYMGLMNIFAMIGGISALIWYVLVGQELLKSSKAIEKQ